MSDGAAAVFGIGFGIIVMLISISNQLFRIAKALEERNKP